MITGRGIGYLLLLAAIYLVLAYSGISQLIVVLLAALLLPVISAIHLLLAGRRLRLDVRLEQPVVSRLEKTSLIISLKRPGWQVVGPIEWIILKPGRKNRPAIEHRQTAFVSGSDHVFAVQLACPHRGSFAVGVKRMVSRDLFGLFGLPLISRRRCRQLLQVQTVLPRPLIFDPLGELTAALLQQQQQSAWQIGSDLDTIANIRTQQPGDALKRAHWKLSARLNTLMIRDFENPRQLECLLLLDLVGMDDQTAFLDFSDFYTDCAAYLAQKILAVPCMLRQVAWQADGRREILAEKPADERLIQLHLADLQPTGRWQADQVLAAEADRNKSARLIILASNRLDEETTQYLSGLQYLQRRIWFLLIYDSRQPDEQLSNNFNRLQKAGLRVYKADFAKRNTYSRSVRGIP